MVNLVKDVQPICDKQQLEDMKWALLLHCSKKDYLLYRLHLTGQ